VVIARAGKPIAKLVPMEDVPKPRKRPMGAMAGQIWIADDFDGPLDPETQALFEGEFSPTDPLREFEIKD